MDYKIANIFSIKTKLKTKWFWLHLPLIIFKDISFKAITFAMKWEEVAESFCFGWIINNNKFIPSPQCLKLLQ